MDDNKSKSDKRACVGASVFALAVVVAFVLFYRHVVYSPAMMFTNHKANGDQFFSAGDYKQAVTEYSDMTTTLPDSEEGFFLRAMAYSKLGEIDKSIADYSHVLKMKIRPQVASSAHNNRALDYRAKHKYSQAIEDYDAVLKWNETDTATQARRADCYRLQGDPTSGAVENEAEYRKNMPVFNKLIASGSNYLAAKQYSNAEAEYQRAIQVNPSDANGWASVGWTEYLLGHVSSAMKFNRTALKIDPYLPYAGCNMALCYAVQSNWAAAKPYYQAGTKYASDRGLAGAAQDLQDAKALYSGSTDTLDKASSFLESATTGKQ